MKYLLMLIISLFLATPAFAGEMCEISAPHNCINASASQSINLTHKSAALHNASQEPVFLSDSNQNLVKTAVSYSGSINSNANSNSSIQHRKM